MLFKRFVKDLKRYFPYSVRFAKSQLKTEVAGSYLGWIWWVLQPLCLMFVYSLVFGVFFNAREEYMSLFIFIGLTLWNFFSHTINHSVKMISANKSMLMKVYVPKFILLLSEMIVNSIKMLINFGIIAVMMIIFQVPLTWRIFWIFPIIIALFLFSYAVGIFLMHFGVYVKDLANVITIVLRFLLYMTGIFFDVMKRVPEPYNTWLLRINPMANFIVSARNALLYDSDVHWVLLLLWIGISAVLCVLGTWLVYKKENDYAKVV